MQIDLYDYFCKYGFQDGDDEEVNKIVFDLRPIFIETLNRVFQQRNLPYTAHANHVGTSHNAIRMLISWKTLDGRSHTWEKTPNAAPPQGVMEAINTAKRRIEKMRHLSEEELKAVKLETRQALEKDPNYEGDPEGRSAEFVHVHGDQKKKGCNLCYLRFMELERT